MNNRSRRTPAQHANVFRMPAAQTMVARKSSITNAFVCALIPSVHPTLEEVHEAIECRGLDPNHLTCTYCGDIATEWDHLRPLVLNRRPTGFISEIANLVPSCGKCNQSKGNKPWRDWMRSAAPRSPTTRGIADVEDRIRRIERFEQWREPTQVDFQKLVGEEHWARYWQLCETMHNDLRQAESFAAELRLLIARTVAPSYPTSQEP